MVVLPLGLMPPYVRLMCWRTLSGPLSASFWHTPEAPFGIWLSVRRNTARQHLKELPFVHPRVLIVLHVVVMIMH